MEGSLAVGAVAGLAAPALGLCRRALVDLIGLDQRLPVAEQWLKSHNVEAVARARFDEFLKQSPSTAATVKTETDREALFRQFQAWEAERSRGAQARAPAGQTQR